MRTRQDILMRIRAHTSPRGGRARPKVAEPAVSASRVRHPKRKSAPLRIAPKREDVVVEQVTEPSPQVTAAKTGGTKIARGVKYDELIAAARHLTRSGRGLVRSNPFVVPQFPPGMVVPEKHRMAMDDATGWAAAQFSSAAYQFTNDNLFSEGLGFLGYTYLAELAQRPEYRTIVETIATDMTRKWIRLKAKGETEDKTEKIGQLNDELDRLSVKEVFEKCEEIDGYFGRAHLYIDTGESEEPKELVTPIGDGWNKISQRKIGKGSIQRLVPIEPVWVYPTGYNTNNPLLPSWYNPQMWFVQGTEVHQSRLLKFVGREVPDLLKPAYAFGGLSLTQMVKPYVTNWLNTRQSVADIVQAFSVMVLSTNLQATLQEGGDSADAVRRADLFNILRTNSGLMMLDKDTELFDNVSAPLGTLDQLQAQSQEQMASISRIPLIKLLGIAPHGLNATAEPEIKSYNENILSAQTKRFHPNLQRIIGFAMLNIWGKVDPDIMFEFITLHEATEKEKAEIQKLKSETDSINIDNGVVDPAEARSRIAGDPDSMYSGLDPDDVPEPPEEDVEGEGGEGGGGGPGGGGKPADGAEKPDKGAAADSVIPFPGAADDFNEADHPRAPDGKFGTGSGSGTSKPALKASELRKVGKQMGSNDGGVFETANGDRFYVKKGKTKDHVTNEITAANLYQLAGLPTLNYRPVEGGTHVATEMAKLDKDNVSKLSPAERKTAQEAFAVHAWLSNWDAAGTGGDNQGVVNGKVTTLDVGGALEYRAQGGPKGGAFGETVTELNSMRNASMSPDAARLFGKMTTAEVKASIERVAKIPDDKIRETVKASGGKPGLAEKLIARKRNMAKAAGVAMDEANFEESKHPRKDDGKFATKGGGSSGTGGAAAPAPKEAKQSSAGSYGGLYHTKAATPAENHKITAAKILAQPTKIGINPLYRLVLEKLLKESKEHGTEGYIPDLKAKLHDSYVGFAQLLADKAQTVHGAEHTKFNELAQKALKKAKSFKPDGPVSVPISEPPKAEPKPAPEPAPKPEPKPAPAPEPVKAKHPPPTAAELQKASKGVALKVQYVPGAPQTPAAEKLVAEFNGKWVGKENLSPEKLIEKVNDFKDLTAAMVPLQTAAQKDAAEYAAKTKAEQQEKQKKIAEQAAAAMAAKLGSPEKVASFNDLAGVVGKNGAENYLSAAETKINSNAKLKASGISAVDAAHVVAYSGAAYKEINQALRAGVMTPEQWSHTKQLNAALDKLPPHEGTTYRKATMPAAEMAKFKPGMVITQDAFTSTSKHKGVWSGATVMTIHGTGGRDIQPLSLHHSEAEVLFKAGTRFQVVSISGNQIEMKEV